MLKKNLFQFSYYPIHHSTLQMNNAPKKIRAHFKLFELLLGARVKNVCAGWVCRCAL